MAPIVELSFMPSDLASSPNETVFHYRGGTSAPSSYPAWSKFIAGFVGQLVDRYGLAAVRQWRFEVWNEPNCGFLFPYGDGCCEETHCGTPEVYFQIYAATARAIKTVDSQIPVSDSFCLSHNHAHMHNTQAHTHTCVGVCAEHTSTHVFFVAQECE